MSWFGSLIQPVYKDDSMPLLSVSKKHYRDLILANSISVFDFRIYLLARQCALLNKMRRPSEICQKVTTFLGTFGRRLREVEVRGCVKLCYIVLAHALYRPRYQNILLSLGYSLLLSASSTNVIRGICQQTWMISSLHGSVRVKVNFLSLPRLRSENIMETSPYPDFLCSSTSSV